MASRAAGHDQGLMRRATSIALAAVMAAGFPGYVLASEPAAATGALSLSTDPAGATVYVDGRAQGRTPVELDSLAAGDHRVRVVKPGFLENSRLVSVRPGQTNQVRVKLTPHASMQVEDQPPREEDQGGGKGKKIALIGLGVAAVGVGAFLLLGGNDPPTPGNISVSPTGTGMAGVTSFTLASQGATDPDGDPLTFAWSFGDGSSGSGQSVTKTYNATGSYNVTLTVSDGDHTVTTPGVTVNVARSMAGVWSCGAVPGFTATQVAFNLTQNGSTLGGTMTFTGDIFGTISGVTGSVSALTYPNTASFRGTFTVGGLPGSFTTAFTGTSDANGNTITGTTTTTSTALTPPSFSTPATCRR